MQTISYVAKNPEILDNNTALDAIPFIEYDEPQAPVQAQSNQSPSPVTQSLGPAVSQFLPVAAISPDMLTEPISTVSKSESEHRITSKQLPPRRAKSAWIKQQPQIVQNTSQTAPFSAGQQLAQQFNTYMQQQKRPSIRGTSHAYDLAVEAYGRRILTAICDASHIYEKSVLINEPINENIRCTITLNKDGKIQKIKLEPPTGNVDMDKAIEGLCKVSTLPKIPENLSTNTFDFTVYFRLGKTKKGINKVRFVPNRV